MISTHFRFKSPKEAKEWDRTVRDWIPINEIHIAGDDDYIEISAASFAWVIYTRKEDNLEFKIAKFTKKDLKEFNEE